MTALSMMKSAFTETTPIQRKVEALTADIEALRQDEATAREQLGICEMEGQDTTEAEATLQRIERQIRALEAALTVAQQKGAAAQVELRNAEREVLRGELREKLVRLATIGKATDEAITKIGKLAAEAIAVIHEIQPLGDSALHTNLVDSIKWFRVCLLDACVAMPGCETGQDLFKQRLPWSARLPEPSKADTVKFGNEADGRASHQ